MVECAAVAGWKVEVYKDGITYNNPPEQRDAIEASITKCQEEWDRANPEPEMTAERAKRLYRAEVEATECIRRQGYDPGPVPPEQEYVDKIMAGKLDWGSHIYVSNQIPMKEWDKLEAVCPQLNHRDIP